MMAPEKGSLDEFVGQNMQDREFKDAYERRRLAQQNDEVLAYLDEADWFRELVSDQSAWKERDRMYEQGWGGLDMEAAERGLLHQAMAILAGNA